jgi:hypothetical protein
MQAAQQGHVAFGLPFVRVQCDLDQPMACPLLSVIAVKERRFPGRPTKRSQEENRVINECRLLQMM